MNGIDVVARLVAACLVLLLLAIAALVGLVVIGRRGRAWWDARAARRLRPRGLPWRVWLRQRRTSWMVRRAAARRLRREPLGQWLAESEKAFPQEGESR